MVSEKTTEAPKDFVVYPDDRPSTPDGKLVWDKQNCASCHGANGAGASGPALNDPLAMGKVKPVENYRALTYGKDQNHQLQGKISNREIWNLVFYVRTLSRPMLTTAQLDVVTPVFGSNCAVCHGTKGDGEGPLGRNLEPNPANFQTFRRFYDRTDDTLYDHIANGIKWEGMPNFLGKEDRKKNFKFDHDSIWQLVQYVRTFHESADATDPAAIVAAAPKAGAAAPAAETKTAPAAAEKKTEAPADKQASEQKDTSAAAPENKADSAKQDKPAASPDAGADKNSQTGEKPH